MDFELKTLTRARICTEKCDALVLLVPQDAGELHAGEDPISQLAALAIKSGDFEGKAGKLLAAYRPHGVAATRLMLVGVGDGSPKNIRVAVLAAAQAWPAAPALEPELPPAPAYLTSGRLDPGPRPLEDVEPVYPEEAKQQVGTVVLRLLINETGAVDNVAVVRASPAGPFEASALEAFGKAKFSPGKMLGVAVKSQITIEVMFTPINRGKVSGRSY